VTAFYLPLPSGDFRATEHTVGPWAETEQHAGPPAALLVRALESLVPSEGHLARVSVDLLGAVPIADMTIRSRVVRPGRSVQLAEAELTVGGRVVARATGWWHRHTDTAVVTNGALAPPPFPDGHRRDEHPWPGGYLRAIDWRWVHGGLADEGPATVWCRMRMPLVDGEAPTAIQRVFVIADSGNGISAVLSPQQWLFVNTELTVHLFRPPTGEWIGMDAQTTLGPAGAGLAASRLYDSSGQVGRGAQALIVRPRGVAN
jgi:Thioesterase-like superfamily